MLFLAAVPSPFLFFPHVSLGPPSIALGLRDIPSPRSTIQRKQYPFLINVVLDHKPANLLDQRALTQAVVVKLP